MRLAVVNSHTFCLILKDFVYRSCAQFYRYMTCVGSHVCVHMRFVPTLGSALALLLSLPKWLMIVCNLHLMLIQSQNASAIAIASALLWHAFHVCQFVYVLSETYCSPTKGEFAERHRQTILFDPNTQWISIFGQHIKQMASKLPYNPILNI